MALLKTFLLTDTSPAAAGTTVSTQVARGLHQYDDITIDAVLIGATGGTLDVYLQRKVSAIGVTPQLWHDYCHFPQLADGAPVKHYSSGAVSDGTIHTVGFGDATTATPLLADGITIDALPLELRLVYVAGAGTSAGAAVKIYISAHTATK